MISHHQSLNEPINSFNNASTNDSSSINKSVNQSMMNPASAPSKIRRYMATLGALLVVVGAGLVAISMMAENTLEDIITLPGGTTVRFELGLFGYCLKGDCHSGNDALSMFPSDIKQKWSVLQALALTGVIASCVFIVLNVFKSRLESSYSSLLTGFRYGLCTLVFASSVADIAILFEAKNALDMSFGTAGLMQLAAWPCMIAGSVLYLLSQLKGVNLQLPGSISFSSFSGLPNMPSNFSGLPKLPSNLKKVSMIVSVAMFINVLFTIIALSMPKLLVGALDVPTNPIPSVVTLRIHIGLFRVCVDDRCDEDETALVPLLGKRWQALQAFTLLNVLFGSFVLIMLLGWRRLENSFPSKVALFQWITVGLCAMVAVSCIVSFSVVLDVNGTAFDMMILSCKLSIGASGGLILAASPIGFIASLYCMYMYTPEMKPVDFSQMLLSDSHVLELHHPENSFQAMNEQPVHTQHQV